MLRVSEAGDLVQGVGGCSENLQALLNPYPTFSIWSANKSSILEQVLFIICKYSSSDLSL